MYEWIDQSIELSRSIFQELSLDWDFNMSAPATSAELRACEQVIGTALPDSYRQFLLRHNGAHLFLSHIAPATSSGTCSWWVNSGILVLGTAALEEFKHFTWKTYQFVDEPDFVLPLPIAYLGGIGTGDFCALDMSSRRQPESEPPVLDCNHDDPEAWKDAIIANSFEEWLQKMFNRVIDHRSYPEYWFEDNLQDNLLSRDSSE